MVHLSRGLIFLFNRRSVDNEIVCRTINFSFPFSKKLKQQRLLLYYVYIVYICLGAKKPLKINILRGIR